MSGDEPEVTGGVLCDLSIDMAFEGREVVVGVGGEIDLLTAPTLQAILGDLVQEGFDHVVLDVGAVTFIGAAGLNILAATAAALAASGGTLTIRAASVLVERILDVPRVSDRLRFDPGQPASELPGSTASEAKRHASDARPAAGALADVVRARPRSSTDVVDAALRLVTSLADATVDNADGVSVTLERHGRLMTVAASNDKVLEMDGHQYDTGEGPCLAAKADDRWYYVESLDDETRWPNFVPLALAQDIHSILSSPLKTADRPLGALNIYSSRNNAFGDREQKLAALFAEQASDILTTARADIGDEELDRRFAEGLIARHTVALAQGVLMVRHNITASAAGSLLYRSARAAQVTVVEYATQVLTPFSGGDAEVSAP